MTNEEITTILWDYDEYSFSSLPDWLRHEIRARQLTFDKREPTLKEQQETIIDGIEHRIARNERTIDDFKHIYRRKKDV